MSRSNVPVQAPVLVIGGGPSGLTAALTLVQNNIPVRIIEKEPHYRIGQKASGIWPRTFEMFHFLRAHNIHQKSVALQPLCEYEVGALKPHKTFLMAAHKDSTPSVPYSNGRLVGQPLLEALLRSHLEKYGCHVELATELESFEDDGERVFTKLVKKQDGQDISEKFEASYIIGADGAKGTTRGQLGLTLLGETREEMNSVTGDICIEGQGLDRDHWHLFGDKSANLFMLRPTDEIGPDGFQFILSRKKCQPKQLIADEKLMFQYMSEMAGRKIHVKKVVFLSEFRPNIRMADKFGIGRVFIAGDAAHVHSPTGGQGLNTSVQDSFNLAWKVSLVYKGLSPSTLLDTYTEERLPVVSEMLNITTSYLNHLCGTPSIQDAMTREERMNMLGVNYRTSSIVLDEFSHPEPVSAYRVLDERVLVAGDRAPDAPGLVVGFGRLERETGTETRLFDIFSPTHHTVLAFVENATDAADVLDAVRRYPKDAIRTMVVLPKVSEVTKPDVQVEVVVDRDGHAYRAYLVGEESRVVVVRPDGVVGAMVRGAEGLKTYFSKIFA